MTAARFMVKVYFVKGLNMGTERFVWNDKLIIADAGSEYGNVAEIRFFNDKKISEISKFTFDSDTDAEIMCLMTIFLACFRLVNENIDLELTEELISSYTVNSFEDFKTSSSGLTKEWSDTDFPKIPEKYCREALTNTVPLFEKIIKNIDFKQKDPLVTILPFFQQIQYENNSKSLIDLVIVLETLVCENENYLKLKFASRTSSLIQTSPEEEEMNFELLKEIYNLRSRTVHKAEISQNKHSEEYFLANMYLEKIVKRALLKYVELVDSGLTKKQIISQLDSAGIYDGT